MSRIFLTTVEARENFSELIDRAAASGERIVITRHGEPMAALLPLDDLELVEEIGRTASEWDEVKRFYPAPGFATEAMTLFLAGGLAPVADHAPTEEEKARATVAAMRKKAKEAGRRGVRAAEVDKYLGPLDRVLAKFGERIA